jgi:pilus assembly protein FimV
VTTWIRLALLAPLIVPLAAPAAGLGRLAVMSRVGEPLNTEIEVVAVLPGEAESLAAKLAPADAYGQARVAPLPGIDVLRATVARNADGGYVVKVTSTEPVEKPLVNLLVELSWAGGSLVRQYSFLLDSIDRRPPPVVFKPPASGERVAALPLSKPAEPASATAVRTPLVPETGGTYAVQPGDTLGKVAQATRYDGVSVAQMTVAIFRANEDAFIAGDVNRLKGGRTLTIPGRDVAAAVTAEDARQLLAAQRAEAAAARGRPGAARPAGPEGDDATALDRALAESRDRAAALEQALSGLRQLIEARDKEIAELERQVGGKGAGAAQPIRKPAP